MEKQFDKLEEIQLTFDNGNKRDMVELIKKYGLFDFFADYKEYVEMFYNHESQYNQYTELVISYHRITYR